MKTVLVVDDDSVMREFLEEFLDICGYKTIICENGENAVPYIDKVDGIITDLEMPGMSGIELAEMAKNRRPDMPILLITGMVPALIPDNRADTVIYKPFEGKELVPWLRNKVS